MKGATLLARDTVQVTMIYAGLTAHRPLHEGGDYAPFAKTDVEEVHEESTSLGPGIRINNDDDGGGGENDLIEVLLTRDPTDRDFRLRRSSTKIKVWTSMTKGTAIPFPNENGLETDDLPFASGAEELTVWVEWVQLNHGTADLQIKDTEYNIVMDTIKFHTFESILVFLGGRNQVPTDPADLNFGTFDVAIDMYRTGYDAWMYDEDAVSDNGTGLPYDEIMRAWQDRKAKNVAVHGYSKGGGATYDLVEALSTSSQQIAVKYSGYTDAVVSSAVSWASEERRPPGALYHLNIYQTTGGIDGEPTEDLLPTDKECCADNWTPAVTHYTIDDSTQTKDLIKSKLESKLPKR